MNTRLLMVICVINVENSLIEKRVTNMARVSVKDAEAIVKAHNRGI